MSLTLLLGTAVLLSVAFGARWGYAGYRKHAQAQQIAREAKSLYARRKSVFDQQRNETTLALELLGKKEIEIGERIGAFKALADRIVAQLNAGLPREVALHVPADELQRLENYSYAAIDVLGAMAGPRARALAAGFALHGGAIALGRASRGRAVAGWACNSLGEGTFRNARQIESEVQAVIGRMARAVERLDETEDWARQVRRVLACVHARFNEYFDSLQSIDAFLQELHASRADLGKFQHVALRTIDNGYALASILVDVIATPLHRLKQREGQLVRSEDGVPQEEADAEGLPLVNRQALALVLANARRQAGAIEPA